MKRKVIVVSAFVFCMIVAVLFNLVGCGKNSLTGSLSSTANSAVSSRNISSISSASPPSTSSSIVEDASILSASNESYVQPDVSAIIQSMRDETSETVESLQALNSGTAPQLLEFMAYAQEVNVNSMFATYLDFNVSAQGDTLIFSYRYLVDITLDQAQQAEAQVEDFYTNQVQIFKNDGITDAAIHDIYYDKNGNLIYERDYN